MTLQVFITLAGSAPSSLINESIEYKEVARIGLLIHWRCKLKKVSKNIKFLGFNLCTIERIARCNKTAYLQLHGCTKQKQLPIRTK